MKRRKRERYIPPRPLIAECDTCKRIAEIVITTYFNTCAHCLHRWCKNRMRDIDDLTLSEKLEVWESEDETS
jgi:hypothetical protein